jgi:hypothetical protein
VARTRFYQNDLETNLKRNLNYTNLFPRAAFSYAFTQYKRISFNYNGSTRQPTLEQIQPLRENSDPLNQQIGNPNLDQAFHHNFNLNFNTYKVLTNTFLWASISYNMTDNAISNSQRYSANGRRESQFINVDGNRNIRGNMNYHTKIKKLNLTTGFNSGFGLNKFVNVINDRKNINDNNDVRFGPSIGYQKEKKFELNLNANFTYTTSKSSLRPDVITDYWMYDYTAFTRVYLPLKFQVESDINFAFRERINASDRNNDVVKWNAAISKKLLRGDVGLIKLAAFDILDQNIGYSRFATANTVVEKNYNTLRRYFMLSFTWNFSKNGAKPQ